METADNCRRAAREAVADVEPPQLHELVETVLDEASMVPGTLTVKSAAIVAAGTDGTAESSDLGTTTATSSNTCPSTTPSETQVPATDLETRTETDTDTGTGSDHTGCASDALLTHAAGVQLIYEGLRLTRTLAHDEPWLEPETAADGDAASDGDLEILAADILVARGFYLLARTDAAGTAVRTVQSFGHDQTRRVALESAEKKSQGETEDTVPHDAQRGSKTDRATATGTAPETPPADPATVDANLERDILELAIQTGAAAVDESPPGSLVARATELAGTVGTSFPPAEECLAELDATHAEQPSESLDDQSLEEHTTDRATSATDP